MENSLFSKFLKYVSGKNFRNMPKLMLSLSYESVTENITMFSYLMKNHKEYRCWALTVDERNHQGLDINQILIWLSEQDVLTELNLNTHIFTIPCININEILSNSYHLERFYIGRNIKDITPFLNNYTVQSYDNSFTSYSDTRTSNIAKRNRNLREIARKSSLTLMMVRKFSRSLLSPLDKNVVKIIAELLYEQRYEPNHLKTLSVTTSLQMKSKDLL